MFTLDEEKIECTLGNRALAYWHGKKAENVLCFFISDIEIPGIYLSLTLGAYKFKQLDKPCSLSKTPKILFFLHNQMFSLFLKYVSGLSWSKNISKTSKKNEYKKTSSPTH